MCLVLYVFSSTKLENRGAEHVGAVGTGGREQVAGKGVGRWIWSKQCMHMYVNTKMTPVATVLGIRGGRKLKYDVFDTL
jgi:hypothetical protein